MVKGCDNKKMAEKRVIFLPTQENKEKLDQLCSKNGISVSDLLNAVISQVESVQVNVSVSFKE